MNNTNELKWFDIKRRYEQTTLNNAQMLRKSQTDAEKLLWYYLSNKQLGGFKFRRQQPIGQYIVDFICFSEKLIIELDGSQHATNQSYDQNRDAFLRTQGFKILRFWNNEVFEHCFDVLEMIYKSLSPPTASDRACGLSSATPPTASDRACGLSSATPPQGRSD